MKTKIVLSEIVLGMTAAALVAGCSAKIDTPDIKQGQKTKNSAHVNYAQCSNATLEVLVDYTASDLENQDLENGAVQFRDVTTSGSAYGSFTTNSFTNTTWGTESDPSLREFILSTLDGAMVDVSTHDFVTGNALYVASKGSTGQALSCKFSVAKPGPLPVPQADPNDPSGSTSSQPEPVPQPGPQPQPQPGPAQPSANALYVDCKGSALEVYADFTMVDRVNWSGLGNARFGYRPVGQSGANFIFSGNSAMSSYAYGGTDYASLNIYENDGSQLDVNLSTADFVSASAQTELTDAAGANSTDSLSCSWLASNRYAGQFGW